MKNKYTIQENKLRLELYRRQCGLYFRSFLQWTPRSIPQGALVKLNPALLK